MKLIVWGEDKTGKSTLALTAPKPLAYFVFDVGGDERALWKFEDDVNSGNIITSRQDPRLKTSIAFKYPQPLPKISLKEAPLSGFKELWNRFLLDYVWALENPKIKSVVIDTGTLLWEIVRQGFLQEKQEFQMQRGLKSGESMREKLLPIEYAEPNSRMRALLQAAGNQGKNIVMTHHARDEFKAMATEKGIEEVRTGTRECAGWSGLGAIADVVVHTEYKKGKEDKKPEMYATVDMSGVCLQIVGLSFKDPSYIQLETSIRNMRKLQVTIKK